MKPKVFLFGPPGKLGGAATKIWDLLWLLRDDVDFCLVLRNRKLQKDREIKEAVRETGIRVAFENELPSRMEGVALVICELDIFSTGRAQRIKERGLKLFFSNEMMWAFKGEEEAVKAGLIDKVLFVSEFQSSIFRPIYEGVPQAILENYVLPKRFPFVDRHNVRMRLGRLSRPDPVKFTEDFPVFYEALKVPNAKFRVMGWSDDLHRKYDWHDFGDQWDLLKPKAESATDFLHSIDLFVYAIGPFFQESWGRVVAEAMLTGAIPLVPSGHHFENIIADGEAGYLCNDFDDYHEAAQRLYWDYPLKRRMSKHCAQYARSYLCDQKAHRRLWINVLTE